MAPLLCVSSIGLKRLPMVLTERSVADVVHRIQQRICIAFGIVADVFHHAEGLCIAKVGFVKRRGEVDQSQQRHDDQVQLSMLAHTSPTDIKVNAPLAWSSS